MTVFVYPAAMQEFTRDPNGQLGRYMLAKTLLVTHYARAEVSTVMARTGVPAEALVGYHMDSGIYGEQGHVGTIGSGKMAQYLARKEEREHRWLTPAIKAAGFVEA